MEEIEMEVEEQVMEEETPSIDTQSTITPAAPPSVPALPSGTSNVKIKKDYNPKGITERFVLIKILYLNYCKTINVSGYFI